MSKDRRILPHTRWLPWALVLGAMGLAAALVLPRLGERLFWDDEANTAIYARNLIRFGRITAWDGTNLSGYGMGGALGEDLGQELRVPTLPAHVAAVSMCLFGESTFAGRLPFALAGVASVGLLAVWMRRHLGRKFPYWLPSLLLAASPAMLLYSRNCRYYSLGVLFSLIVLALWAPGERRPIRRQDRWFAGEERWRCLGAMFAISLLVFTHYLNAAALLATLPSMFLDRRYRQRRQYTVFTAMLLAAAAAGVWILATANPFQSQYDIGQAWLFAPPRIADRWTRFWLNAVWYLRDLGTHEFIPWLLLTVLLVPWLPGRRFARQRPLAWRGIILTLIVVAYIVLAAAALPPDMGKGPAAEMRYIVPVLAFGAALGGLALLLLWRICWPLAIPLAGLLIGSNWLHLGGSVDRYDRPNPWWPPTIYCYVRELLAPLRGGDEELVGLLAQLPPGTTTRIWPSFMAYPPMFYLPQLHYCDQLTQRKAIRDDLRDQLPDYLFVEKARPEVVVVPPAYLGMAMEYLKDSVGPNQYRLCKALLRPFLYTAKPEIPMHWFRMPGLDWKDWPGAVVLARIGSAAERSEALASNAVDREHGALALWNVGVQAAESGNLDATVEYCDAALRLQPGMAAAHVSLGSVCEARRQPAEAMRHYRQALSADAANAVAHFNLANLLLGANENDEAEQHYRFAIAAKAGYAQAHYNLGVMLLRQGRTQEAREQLASAQQSAAVGTRLYDEARRLLQQIK